MNCWFCGSDMIWGGDFSHEDYGLETDGVVTNLSCSNEECCAYAEFYSGAQEAETEADTIIETELPLAS